MRRKFLTMRRSNLRKLVVFVFVMVFAFSNFVSFLPQGNIWKFNFQKLAESLKIKEALAA